MALKPLNDRIIIEPSVAETRTASGLVLPDSAQEKPQKGVVLAVGPGKRLDNGTLAKPDVSVGDTILYGKYSGTEVKLSGKEYVILRADEVLGILVGEKSAAKPVAPKAKGSPKPAAEAKASPKAKPAKTASSVAKVKPAKGGASNAKAKPKAVPAKPAAAKTKAKPAKKGKK